jgi:hypothetical protein
VTPLARRACTKRLIGDEPSGSMLSESGWLRPSGDNRPREYRQDPVRKDHGVCNGSEDPAILLRALTTRLRPPREPEGGR